MDSILGYLAQFDSFARQGELLCTQGLTFLLRDQDGERALRELVSAATNRQPDLDSAQLAGREPPG